MSEVISLANSFDLKSYARRGAEVRLAELKDEMTAIYAAFPDLRRGRPPSNGTGTASPTPRRRRRKMSAAARARLAASARNRWAAAKRAGKNQL
jgi:hypothetical protein